MVHASVLGMHAYGSQEYVASLQLHHFLTVQGSCSRQSVLSGRPFACSVSLLAILHVMARTKCRGPLLHRVSSLLQQSGINSKHSEYTVLMQIEDAFYFLPNPFPEGNIVGVVKQTLGLVDGSSRQVPLSEVHVTSVICRCFS